jgi:hypothetical protein
MTLRRGILSVTFAVAFWLALTAITAAPGMAILWLLWDFEMPVRK